MGQSISNATRRSLKRKREPESEDDQNQARKVLVVQDPNKEASSSSSSSSSRWDVFLSFRGEDTGTNFTAHLYAALQKNGINTFMADEKLRSGDEISPALLKAIEESGISIIILSKNYASSRWCLDELIKILDCKKTRGQQVLPLFYDVTPSEVRYQTNAVGKAFAQLEKRYKDDDKKVKMWKSALTQVANLSGKDLKNERNEAQFIQEIIEWVNSILVKKTNFQVAQHPVGIESHLQKVKSLLDIEKNDTTRMVGIFGHGGIGKTTIAKAIYNSMAFQFEGSCFLENIRETSGQMGGLIKLQYKLLSEILEGSSPKVDKVDRGITLIKERLRLRRVLLVLDDVDHLEQLEKLAGKCDWFGLGSRIILTTRDKHLLSTHGVNSAYQVNELDHNEALQLFSCHAFNRDRPDDDFVNVTEDAVSYCGGLPLALKVLGSTLKGRELPYWKSKLVECKSRPPNDIQKILRISFDGLDENAKNIFLDIACFFKGRNVEEVTKILDCTRGSHSYSVAIEELMDKCLVTQSRSKRSLEMHDLLQEMGREIVRQESIEPGNRSRLWFHEDVRKVLKGNTGTNKVEGILIDLPEPDLIHLSPKAFENMTRLKMFINRNARFSEEPNFLSTELRLLDWYNYSGKSLPFNLWGNDLVCLTMPRSQLKELKGVQNFQNLTIMNFRFSNFLRKIPDVSSIPNLNELDLCYCKNLVKVHHSIGSHDKLVGLNLEGCINLRSFPKSLKMRSLKFLNLNSCKRLKKFPEIKCQMECLEDITFCGAGIKELPSSIGCLVGVKTFGLNSYTNLMTLSDNSHKLRHLDEVYDGLLKGRRNRDGQQDMITDEQRLVLNNCSKVDEFLKTVLDTTQSMPGVVSIEESTISSVAELIQLPFSTITSDSNDDCSSIVFPKPRSLYFSYWALSGSNLFRIIDCCSTLTKLSISKSDIVTIPPCIRRFVRLKYLELYECKQLRKILGIPPNLISLKATGCVSLAIFLEEARRSPLFNTPDALFQVRTIFPALTLGNHVLTKSEFLIQRDCPSSLRYLDLSRSAIVILPTWLNTFVGLNDLNLQGCNRLEEIPELPPNIEEVNASECTSLERFQFNNMKDLPYLHQIDFSNCHGLRENMGDDLQIRFLSEGHLEDRSEFSCIFPGNKISDYFNHRKELSNTNQCEIDINEPLHLDLRNTRFSFFAVVGREDVQDEVINEDRPFEISVEVINDIGHHIHSNQSYWSNRLLSSDHVWSNLNVVPCHSQQRMRNAVPQYSQVITNNLRVIFRIKDALVNSSFHNYVKPVFKSCGFHLKHRHERKR